MTSRVLVAYATKRGSTREVAEAVADALQEQGVEVDVCSVGGVEDVSAYDAVVLGGALYMGRWHADAQSFLKRHRRTLAALPVFVFAMGPLTLEDKDVAGSRRQLDGALAKVREVEPVSVAIFGGVVDPEKLHFPLNRMPASDARDWEAIRSWAESIGSYFRARFAAEPEAVGTRRGNGG